MRGRFHPGRLAMRLLQPYWRLTRGLTLGAQAVVIDGEGRVLLVRHGYRPGWFLPGGGVERGESVVRALERELGEEAGVALTGPAELHGLFANPQFAGDHIAVYVVRAWRRTHVPKPNAEIAERDFFAPDALPAGTDPGTRRRVQEAIDGRAPGAAW